MRSGTRGLQAHLNGGCKNGAVLKNYGRLQLIECVQRVRHVQQLCSLMHMLYDNAAAMCA